MSAIPVNKDLVIENTVDDGCDLGRRESHFLDSLNVVDFNAFHKFHGEDTRSG